MSFGSVLPHLKTFTNNWLFRRITLQTLCIGGIQLLTILFLSIYTDILHVSSVWTACIVTATYTISQWLFWYLFVRFIARVHPYLYPFFAFTISGMFVLGAAYFIPGFSVSTFLDSITVVCILTITSTIAAVIFGMDDDSWFAFNVTHAIVKRYGKTKKTDKPGFIFLEIDGLSYDILNKALAEGYMPTLQAWLDKSHNLIRWETDLSSQTAAMQAGILQGNNTDVPAYHWYDRITKHIVNSANPMDAMKAEARLTNHHGLLEQGGTSRGNMFSGDADESLFTFSTLFDKQRSVSPAFYLFLLNPYIASRIITKLFLEIIFEIKDGIKQWLFDRRPCNISRGFPYPLIRGFMNSLLPELVTYIGSIDIFRGIPATYLLYPGYDDLAHFSGIDRKDSLKALASCDAWFSKIARMAEQAPRPYFITVLSDHGQSEGVYFNKKYGIGLKELVESLLVQHINVYATLESNEQSYLINLVLTETARHHLKTSTFLKKSLESVRDPKHGYINVTPKLAIKDVKNTVNQKDADLIVLATGCLGLIYAGKRNTQMMYEQIETLFPGFLQGLANHDGIGFVLVHSQKKGGIVIGKQGIYYLKTGKVEGVNPLLPYGKNAARHLKKHHAYANAPDILINSSYDPVSGNISGFEKQVGHHGGLGGYQTRPFLLYPKELPVKKDIVGAVELYSVLHSWRKKYQQ